MAMLTDGKRIADITMKVWNGNEWGPDWSDDFFEVGGLKHDDRLGAYEVEDVYYCIEQANDWKNSDGDFSDDATSPYDKDVCIEVVKNITAKNHGEFYWWIDTDYRHGDFDEPKFALFCVDRDPDSEKYSIDDPDEPILWARYEDVPGCDPEGDDWEPIKEFIVWRLGFLPDYDIN